VGQARILRRTSANGTVQSFDHDGVGRPVRIEHRVASSNTLVAGFAYGHDRMSNRTYQQYLHQGGTGDNYFYDSASRMVHFAQGVPAGSLGSPAAFGASQTALGLDGADNRITETSSSLGVRKYASDNDNRYAQIVDAAGTAHQRAYDNNGNLTDDGDKLYGYDFLNRLVSIRRKSDGQQLAAYSYDAFMRQTSRSVFLGTPATTHQVWDGWQLVEERDQSGTLQAQHVYGNYVDEVIQTRRTTSASATEDIYYHQDGVSSVAATTGAAGAVMSTRRRSARRRRRRPRRHSASRATGSNPSPAGTTAACVTTNRPPADSCSRTRSAASACRISTSSPSPTRRFVPRSVRRIRHLGFCGGCGQRGSDGGRDRRNGGGLCQRGPRCDRRSRGRSYRRHRRGRQSHAGLSRGPGRRRGRPLGRQSH
jgi:hypothetical protein